MRPLQMNISAQKFDVHFKTQGMSRQYTAPEVSCPTNTQ